MEGKARVNDAAVGFGLVKERGYAEIFSFIPYIAEQGVDKVIVDVIGMELLPLGIQETASYQSGIVKLETEDWLVIFTDGLIEAVNSRNEEYGEMRLLNLLEGAGGATPTELLRRITADLDAFVGNTPQHDDVTCLLIKAV